MNLRPRALEGMSRYARVTRRISAAHGALADVPVASACACVRERQRAAGALMAFTGVRCRPRQAVVLTG